MPPDNSLPDEIISEILSPALTVADEVFSDTCRVSPFSNYSESTSAYLVVCKSWLRVATPLLYNVVILRSKAQAKALACALSANVDLGRFIKKLRVEGGYGAPMHTILQRAPNVSDLYLSFEIWTPDTTDGLCRGLCLINPSRLILREASRKGPKNRMVSKLVDAVAEAIPKWDRLTVFDCSNEGNVYGRDQIVRPLVQAKRLHTVVIRSIVYAPWTNQLFRSCPLRAIQIKQPVRAGDVMQVQDPLKALLRYTEFKDLLALKDNAPELEIAPSLNPLYSPMSSAPAEVQDAIWSRVLYFAMSVPERAADPKRNDIPERLPLLQVSKTFHRLGLPHYYVHLVLKNWCALDSEWIRSQWPRIETLDGISMRSSGMSMDSFEALAKCSGPSLLECHIRVFEPATPASGAMFNPLTVLRKFTWQSPATFVCSKAETPSNALPRLEELRTDAEPSFVKMLSLINLESLRIVSFSQPLFDNQFFEAHGSKLSELEIVFHPAHELNNGILLDLCPHLTSFTLCYYQELDTPPENILLSRKPAISLAKVTFRTFSMDKDMLASWEQFFMSLSLTSVPSLREIHVPCFEWPTTEREIAKSYWVRCAETFQTRNIDLIDRNGKKWRPRLKVGRWR
ncbi:hypothetical protein GGX14DRAFT_445239 [Mycena pura]|uniref:Uncharacterized protein n=1 Tax=Mycena pura TaxID=153505 RepID=A0AAD6YF51_9AGAR|nr:hypothetical protein GGX14DRAFT_445239 [Mycena pura]